MLVGARQPLGHSKLRSSAGSPGCISGGLPGQRQGSALRSRLARRSADSRRAAAIWDIWPVKETPGWMTAKPERNRKGSEGEEAAISAFNRDNDNGVFFGELFSVGLYSMS